MPHPGWVPRGVCAPCRGKGFSALRPHSPLSPLDPAFLLPRGIQLHAARSQLVPVLRLELPKKRFEAHAKASGGGFPFTTIITPQGACHLLCSEVIKTSTLKTGGVFPSVSALHCVGRSLIHGSVLQPSHDRWVGWSEIQDLVTHEIAPGTQGSFTLPPSTPQTVSWLLFPAQHPTSPAGSRPSLQVLGQAPCCAVPLRLILSRAGGAGEPIQCIPTERTRKASLVIHPIKGTPAILTCLTARPASWTPSFLHHWIDRRKAVRQHSALSWSWLQQAPTQVA